MLSLLSTVYILALILSSRTSLEKESIETANLPKADIPYAIKPEAEIKTLPQVQYNIPQNLPVLKISASNSLPLDVIKFYAKNLGFKEDPLTAKDKLHGTIYTYKNSSNYLSVWESERKVKYGSSGTSFSDVLKIPNKQLSEEEMEYIGITFLASNFNLKKEDLKLTGIVYMKPKANLEFFDVVEKNEAYVYQMNFSPSVSEMPITTLDPKKNIYSIQILRDGSIFFAELNLIGEITPSLTEIALKNESEINASLSESQVISINNGNYNIAETTAQDIKGIVINEVQTIYLYEDNSKDYIQPYFILKGKGTLANSKDPLPVDLLLRASKE